MTQPKPVTESYQSIRIVELLKLHVYEERTFANRDFYLGSIKLRLVQDPIARDWYLEMVAPGPKCTNTTVSMTTTSCNYGGQRKWFECPKCSKRAGVLYLHEDNFKCRQCIGLKYLSQRMSYRTMSPFFARWIKLMKTEEKMGLPRTLFYKGKVTKRAQRLNKLRAQVGFGMDVLCEKWL